MDSSCLKKTEKDDTPTSEVKQQRVSMDIRKPRSSKTYSAENMLSSNLDGMPRANCSAQNMRWPQGHSGLYRYTKTDDRIIATP